MHRYTLTRNDESSRYICIYYNKPEVMYACVDDGMFPIQLIQRDIRGIKRVHGNNV